jgi:nitrate reductase gamma subunit
MPRSARLARLEAGLGAQPGVSAADLFYLQLASMRIVASTIMVLFTIIGMNSDVHADWLVDEVRWHVSAHGQIMCLDCHGAVAERALHPAPSNVYQPPGSRFQPNLCTGCHDAVSIELEAGRHGGQPLKASQDYERCIDCHDPHTQPRISERASFDPSRPAANQCGACHEAQERLPNLSEQDEACMSCHRRVGFKAPEAVQHSKTLCLACHGVDSVLARTAKDAALPVIDMGPDGFRPHGDVACLTCHPQAARYKHARQEPGDCRQCHARHDEAVTHDAHLTVACGACHLKQVAPRKDRVIGGIGWLREKRSPSRIHAMTLTEGEAACRRCHFSSNALGAAAMVLPAKSVLCLPCHAATFSAADTTTRVALIVFAAGLVGSLSYWFSGALPGVASDSSFRKAIRIIQASVRAVFSIKIFCIAKNLMVDGLLQLKFFRQSPSRWLVHGLMVWPFGLRFLWGMAALLASLWAPERDWPWAMLDKNHPVHGMFFDLTGLMVIVGAAAAMLRRRFSPSAKLPGMPRQDRLAAGLLAAVVLVGFFLEGMRIAMTGYPAGSSYAFIGDALSRLFYGAVGLEDIYGSVWYLHALLTGAFVAYLPFSRMFHIVLAPLLLALNAAQRHR